MSFGNSFLIASACMVALGIGSCAGNSSEKQSADGSQKLLTVFVGSYSEPGDSALRAYSFDPVSGSLEYICSMPVANASYFTQAPSGIIYAVGESDDTSASLNALSLNGEGNSPVLMSSQPVGSKSPCYVAVSPDGKFAVTANYNGADAAVFPVLENGALGDRTELIKFLGTGPVEGRQEQPHPHCIAFTPDGNYMLVNDLGTDRIHQFSLKESGENLVDSEESRDIEIAPGSGPRHIVFNKNGDMAYLINEIGDNVTVLKYDGQTLEPVQYIAADTVGAQGAGDIHLSPDGRHLYASLRLKNDGIVTFDVDPLTGLLTYKEHTATLRHPRNFTLSPDGKMMLVASRDDDAVQVFTIDAESGIPVPTGYKVDIPRPVCVKFIDLPN